MSLVEIDHVIGTLQKELGVCLTLGRRQDARGIYGAMVRLALIHTLKPETLRLIFRQLGHLPEGADYAANIAMLATDKESQLIKVCREVTRVTQNASSRASSTFPSLLS